MATFMRLFAALLLLLSLGVLVSGFILRPLGGWGGPPNRIEAGIISGLLVALAAMFLIAARKLRAISLIYEDLAKEF